MILRKKVMAFALALVVLTVSTVFISGCGDENKQAATQRKAQVRVMKVLNRDTPIVLDYPGEVLAINEVQVKSKVAGYVESKLIRGGAFVTTGQPLYTIDSREYRSELLTAQANLAQSQATYNNALIDLQRYQQLYEAAAIPEQTLTTQQSLVDSYYANVVAMQSKVDLAQQNLEYCTVYSPATGRLGVDDIATGVYAKAGETTLVSISDMEEMYIQFGFSENDYLTILEKYPNPSDVVRKLDIDVKLSDGTMYPYKANIFAVDRSMNDKSSTLLVKAKVPNPEGNLVPGMFVRARMVGQVVENAMLVPQRSIQELLGKNFVMIVDEEGKSKACGVELGPRIGSYFIIEKGIKPTDTVVVEGLTTLTEGVELDVTTVTPEEMGFSFVDSTDIRS